MAPRLPKFNIEDLVFLVVDGDDNMRAMVLDILRSFGIREIKDCKTGDDALTMLESFHPDIIVSEWEMDEMNGIELTRKIRRSAGGANRMTGIIFVTAHTQMWQVEEARDAGITEYLAKPISAKMLYARIVSVIQRPRPFIEAEGFVGPDRRRRRDPYKVGMGRRDADKAPAEEEAQDLREMTNDEIDKMLGI